MTLDQVHELVKDYYWVTTYDNGEIHECYEFNNGEMQELVERIVKNCVAVVEEQYGGGQEQPDGTHSKDWDEAVKCIAAIMRHRFGVKHESIKI